MYKINKSDLAVILGEEKGEISPETKAELMRLYESAKNNSESETITIEDISNADKTIVWCGVNDIDLILKSGMYDSELEEIGMMESSEEDMYYDSEEYNKFLCEVSNRIDWDFIEEQCCEAGNDVIADEIAKALRETIETKKEEQKKMEKINVLVVRPGEYAVMEEIDGSLEGMQKVVGGLIEEYQPFEDEVAIICNEEGKMNGMPLSRAIYIGEEMVDIVAGTFFVAYAPIESEHFLSLPEELAKKYKEMFLKPEKFFRGEKGIVAVPYDV